MVHIVFLIALFCVNPDLNKRYPFRFFSFFILFMFSALRYDYGTDYMSYLNAHTSINEGLVGWGYNDVMFRTLNIMIPNFYVYISLISLFYIFSIWYLIKNNLKINQYWAAIAILLINPYLFLIHLSSLRQTLAICFFIFAINFAIKKKIILYIVFVLIATGFHPSAIILLPLYFFLTEKPINKKYLFISISLLILLLISPLFDILANTMLNYMPSNYRYYYNTGTGNSLRSMLISSVYLFLIVFNVGKLRGKEIIYGKLSLIASILSILTIKVSMISRVGMYFDLFLIITIPQIFTHIEKKVNKLLLFILLLFIYIARYYSFFTDPLWESYREYNTILVR